MCKSTCTCLFVDYKKFPIKIESKVPVSFSFVDVRGRTITEADANTSDSDHDQGGRGNCVQSLGAQVEMNPVNFEFLQNYLGLFPQIPTARESQAVDFIIITK